MDFGLSEVQKMNKNGVKCLATDLHLVIQGPYITQKRRSKKNQTSSGILQGKVGYVRRPSQLLL